VGRAERITGATGIPGDGAEPLRGLVGKVRPVTLAREHGLPLGPALEPLFPSGVLRRGSTVVVAGGVDRLDRHGHDRHGLDRGAEADRDHLSSSGRPHGVTSLALALTAAASAAGSWCAVVGLPDLGLVAAAELGVALERLALVPHPEPSQWVTVVGALLDTLDVVVARPPAHLRPGDARRLTSRARERGGVLVPVLSRPGRPGAGPWADGTDARLVVTGAQWEGPGTGDGLLLGRRVNVTAGGRGAASRERQVTLWLPAPGGGVGHGGADRRPASGTPRARGDDGGGPTSTGVTAAYAGADADRLPGATAEPRTDPATGPLRSAG